MTFWRKEEEKSFEWIIPKPIIAIAFWLFVGTVVAKLDKNSKVISIGHRGAATAYLARSDNYTELMKNYHE